MFSFATMLRILIMIFCLPLACGAFFTALLKKRKESGMLIDAYVYGWIVLFALFEAICVPFIVLRGTFSMVNRIYCIAVCMTVAGSVIAAVVLLKKGQCGAQASPAYEKTKLPAEKKKPLWWSRALWGLALLFGAAQVVYMFFYYYLNGDDAYYVAQSVMTDHFDTMFLRDAYTGYPLGRLDVRHALAALPVFITWFARACGVDAATAAHTVLPPVLFLLLYGIYTMIGRTLFSEDQRYVPLFVLIVQVWYLWGNVSIYTPETFFYTRTWQGKAIFANMIIPLVLLLIYTLIRRFTLIHAILLAMTVMAGVLMTTAAVYLLSALCVIAALYCLILEKNRKKCMGMLLCCIPLAVYGSIYIYLLKLK